MNMISTSRSVRVSLWQIGILGRHATVLISCGDQFSVCIEQPTLSGNQYNPQLRPIWWSPAICQFDNFIEGEPKEEEWRIAYHVKQYVVYHCLVTEMNRHLIQRLSVRLRTPFHTYKDMAQHSVNAIIAIHHNWQLDRAVITICNFIAVSRAYIAWIA